MDPEQQTNKNVKKKTCASNILLLVLVTLNLAVFILICKTLVNNPLAVLETFY